jgi:hypothetical protein
MSWNTFSAPRYRHAYETMARVARYRPAMPADGVTGASALTFEEQADPAQFDHEVIEYARRFIAEEDGPGFHIGRSNGSTLAALIYTIEAARNLCCGTRDVTAIKLLELAVADIKEPFGLDAEQRRHRREELAEQRRGRGRL